MLNLPNEKRGCHRTGFAEKCRKLVLDEVCERWVQVQGKNPNTGEDINRSNCIDDWSFLLQMEHSQQQRQTGAAIESFRNETVKAAEAQGKATEVCVQMARAAIAVAAQSVQATHRIEQALPRPVNGAAQAQIAHQD